MDDDASLELLENTVPVGNTKATHTTLTGDPYSCSFDDKLTESIFYSSYIKQVSLNRKNEEDDALHIGEYVREYAPILFEFTDLYSVTDNNLQLQENVLIDISKILQGSIRRTGQSANTHIFEPVQLTGIILSRVREGEDSLHVDIIFQFPDAIEEISVIEGRFYDNALKELDKKDFASTMNFKGLRRGVYRNAIPMYGSSRNTNYAPYFYTGMVTASSNPSLIPDPPTNVFQLENCALYASGIITDNMISETENDDPEYWLPVLLSVRGHSKKTSKTTKLKTAPEIKFNVRNFDMAGGAAITSDTKEIEHKSLLTFVKLWNPWRLDQSSEWLLIGEAFFNIYKGEEEGITAWMETTKMMVEARKKTLAGLGLDEEGRFLKRFKGKPEEKAAILNKLYNDSVFDVPKLVDITERDKPQKRKKTAVPFYLKQHGDSLYKKYYYSFCFERNTLISIGDNAREDSPVEYGMIHNTWLRSALETSTSELDTHIAIALFRFLWLDWMCETIGDRKVEFYYMGNNKLNIDKGKARLKRVIVEDFAALFYKMKQDISNERDLTDKETKAKAELLLQNIDRIIKKLLTSGYKDRLILEASIFFNKAGCSSFFNENCELTCVNTGVLVASTTGILFRKGRLEDFITKRTTAFYLDNITMDDPGVKRIMKWSQETFLRQKDMIDWWWRFHASLLRGGNDDKIFPFIHGEKGNEGKSAWTRLFETVFGDYCSHVETNYFTETPKNADSATPTTASLRGVRAVWVEEADDVKSIKAGAFKKKTGKDKVRARNLYQEGGTMFMQMTFIGVGNDVPCFNSAGLPVKERLVVVTILAQRCDDAPDDEEEQYRQMKFPRDNFFDQEIDYYGAVTLWLLVQYYGKYIKEKLRPYPKQIVEYTERYWEEKDKYKRFLDEMIDSTEENANDMVDVDDVYEAFKEWHDNNYPKMYIPNNDTLRKELRNRDKKIQTGRYIGMSLRSAKGSQPIRASNKVETS